MTPRWERVPGVGAEEMRVEYIVIASGIAVAIGVRVVSLIWEFRDTFPQPQHAEPNPIRLHEPRPGGRECRDTRSARLGASPDLVTLSQSHPTSPDNRKPA